MFPSTSSRETLRLSGKQNSLFPSGADIKCIIVAFRQQRNKVQFVIEYISAIYNEYMFTKRCMKKVIQQWCAMVRTVHYLMYKQAQINFHIRLIL